MIQWPTDAEFIAAMSDADLLDSYQQTSGKPEDAEAEAQVAEIERSALDI